MILFINTIFHLASLVVNMKLYVYRQGRRQMYKTNYAYIYFVLKMAVLLLLVTAAAAKV